MVATPADLAEASMASPVPGSKEVMAMTLAPWVIAAWAWVFMVVSLPRAFSTMMSLEGTPARARAFLMYGASKSAQRTEEAVSGRRKATLPLPAAATGLSMDMVENVLLKLKALAGTLGAEAAEAVPTTVVIIPKPLIAATDRA